MKYEVAIPSYQRAEQLKDKTLQVLLKHKISPDVVTIFVANEEQFWEYKKVLSDSPYNNLQIAVPGMGAVRNFIRRYYPEGTRVFHMDDDIVDVLRKESDKKMVPIDDLEKEVILRGFNALEEHKANLFGIYAAANAMFMKHRISTGLYYCIGSMWGNIIRHDEDLMVTMDDKEDYERTLQYYVKDSVVVRLDDITVKTKYYGTGGMQERRTEKTIEEGAKALVARYPHLCTAYIRETTGHWELKLRDSGQKPVENTLEGFFG